MSDQLFVQLLDLTVGVVLLSAFVVLWRRGLVAIVRALTCQGVALASTALVLGWREGEIEPVAVAAIVFVLKAVVLPTALLRIVRSSGESREVEPLVNVPASLLAAALLTLVAYATSKDIVALDPSPQTRAIPVGIAVALIGFFVLVTRRKAVTQIVGFLLVDNGIALVAFLATSGVPLVVELGAALDVLLAVFILQVFASRMRAKFGAMDLDLLNELRD